MDQGKSSSTKSKKDLDLFSDVKSLAVISYGDQSVTFRAHLLPDTNRVYACKQVSIRRDANQSVEQLERVYHWVRHLVHPNIIRYRQMRKTQTVFLVVMDYWARGSIDDLLKETSQPLTPKRAKTWFAQVLGAVSYLHGLAHRNIRLSSMLINDDEMVVLSGFVNCCLAHRRDMDIMRQTVVGQLEYRSPEMHALCSQIWPYEAKAADMYALGVALFITFNLDPPYDPKLYESNPLQYILYQRQREYRFNPQFEPNVDAKMKNLLASLLEPMPGVRITASAALLHESLAPD